MGLLRTSCKSNTEIAKLTSKRAKFDTAGEHVALIYCATGEARLMFAQLEELCSSPLGAEMRPEWKAFDLNSLDWSGRHDLLIRLLERRDPTLTRALLGGSIPFEVEGLPAIDSGDPSPWVAWMLECLDHQGERAGYDKSTLYWVANQLAFLIAKSSASTNKKQLNPIARFQRRSNPMGGGIHGPPLHGGIVT